MTETTEQKIVGEVKHNVNTTLIVVLALSAVAVTLSILVLIVVVRLSDSVDSQQSEQDFNKQRDARTECVRDINNEVNDQRWTAIARIFEASNNDAAQAKQVAVLLGTTDEHVKRRIETECPPPVERG